MLTVNYSYAARKDSSIFLFGKINVLNFFCIFAKIFSNITLNKHHNCYMKKILSVLCALLLNSWALQSIAQSEPTFQIYNFDDGAIIQKMSDNGHWAVATAANAENTLLSTGPRLINLTTQEVTELWKGYNASQLSSIGVNDVTDDGTIAVGEVNGQPAYWKKSAGKFIALPLHSGCNSGYAKAVTPDGRFAIGTLSYTDNIFAEVPALWDLTSGELLETLGLPTQDMAHENKDQNRFTDISADGRYILGCMSFSYLPTGSYLGGVFQYVYDRTKESYVAIGFDESSSSPWKPWEENLSFISTAAFSNDGNYVTGNAYLVEAIAGSAFPKETILPYLYNVSTGQFQIFPDGEENGLGGWSVDNSGQIFAAAPISNPYREWSIRVGNYWYGFSLMLKQRYGIDFTGKTGIENTGTPLCISNDGKKVAVLIDPYSSYVVSMPESFSEACSEVDLLGAYSVSPTAGAGLNKLQKIDITFDRNIKVLCSGTAAQIRDAEGNTVYSSISVSAEAGSKVVAIRFRKGELSDGKNYTLHIPAGAICIENDQAATNKAIDIPYKGRANTPVECLSLYPEEGASVTKIDGNSNPVLLTFDTQVMLTETAAASLYMADEAAPFCDLVLAYRDNQVAAFPLSTQYLYKGANYRIVIPAGCITDLAGNCANEEITINYVGGYEREVSYDDKTLFAEDFNNGFTNLLLYDGDRNTPSEAMQAWGFADGVNYPWWVVHDDENSADMAAASHSSYTPRGKSKDWMVIPQLYLPDELCILKFQSQSYLEDASDYLKIIVWECDNVYNVLDEDITNKILNEGTVVYDELQSPGDSEDALEGDWTDNTVSLANFAGKNIYIAFLNDNIAQSAVMVDNIEVLHNLPFLVTLDFEHSVVNKTSLPIKGRILIDAETRQFSTVSLQLKDSEGHLIESLHENGLSLKKGDSYSFEFSKEFPLTAGRENGYSLVVQLDDTQNTLNGVIKNLAFLPTKRLVLEEYTGMTCQNCPLGILAIEKIKSIYGKQFIPISIHTYPGDNLGTGMAGYSDYFAFTGAPSGIINRKGAISYPMVSIGQDYSFNAPEGEAPLWLDIVTEEMNEPTEADITATATLSADAKTISVPCSVRYALDAENVNANLFMVVLEDNVLGYQQNNLMSLTDPDLGEWGQGGEYAKSAVYPFYHNDVARGWVGRTISGTPGLLPSTVKAGENYEVTLTAEVPASVSDVNNLKVVVMLLNANNETVINAAEAPVGDATGIDNATTSSEVFCIATAPGQVIVSTAAQTTASLYSTTGTLLAEGSGCGHIKLSTGNYRGVALLKIENEAQVTVVRKLMLK